MQASELEPLVGGTGTDLIDGAVPEGDERDEDPSDLKITFRSDSQSRIDASRPFYDSPWIKIGGFPGETGKRNSGKEREERGRAREKGGKPLRRNR